MDPKQAPQIGSTGRQARHKVIAGPIDVGAARIQGALLVNEGRFAGALRPEALEEFLHRAARRDRVPQPPDALLDAAQLPIDFRPSLDRRALTLAPERGRPGDRVADEPIVEAGADRVEECGVKNLVAEPRAVRAGVVGSQEPVCIVCGGPRDPLGVLGEVPG